MNQHQISIHERQYLALIIALTKTCRAASPGDAELAARIMCNELGAAASELQKMDAARQQLLLRQFHQIFGNSPK